MMNTVTVDEAQSSLANLVHSLSPGDEIGITENDQTVARLVVVVPCPPNLRRLGTMKGTVLKMSDDFDAPLDDFREYMP